MSRRTLARTIIFFVATFLMLYALTIAAISFRGLNITAFHLSQPLLIGYGIFWLIVAPSGLWGIFGSIQNNSELFNRYLRDHWFSSALISTVDIVKIVFSFTMKDNSIQKCLASTDRSDISIENCHKKVDFSQKAGLVLFGIHGSFLIGLGILVWFSCKRLLQKKDEKIKVPLDLETQNTRQLNDDSSVNTSDLVDQTQNIPLETNSLPQFVRRSSQGQNDQQKIGNKNIEESREIHGGGNIKNANNTKKINNTKNVNNVSNTKNVNNVNNTKDINNINNTKKINNVNNTKNIDNVNNTKYIDNVNNTKYINNVNNTNNFNSNKNVNDVNNVKNVQRFDPQQYMTPRPRKSYDRQMPSFDEFQIPQRQGPPPQGMGTMSRSKSTNMAPRSNSNRLPPPLPEYRSMQPMQYPPGVLGMQNRVPFPPSYYNRPPPFPQFQQYPNFQPMYPWQQQQWIEFNNRPKPPQGDFRGHRRSKSHPQLRPLPVPPGSTEQQDPIPPQISKQQTILPPQIIEQQIVDSKTKNKNKNNNDDDNSRNKSTNSRRSSTSSRYKPSLSPVIEQKSPYSQMSRSNSLPNLSSHEDLMRNELLFAPPVPLIPSNIQPGTKNNNKNNNKSNNKNTESQPPIIDNTDKFERFIKMYGNKDYNMMSENPQYNKYSEIQDDDNNGWNSNENNDYIPPKRPRPKSAHSVKGEASPKSSMYIEDVKNRPYNDDYYYYGPSSGYGMNQEMMNSRNNNYAYAQYVGPMGYNNGRNFVQNNPMGYNDGWVNYGQQRPQGMNYYY